VKGIFALTSPADLFAKLTNDLHVLRRAPDDAYAAFNFFVTAEHLLDWLYPGAAGEAQRKQRRKQEVLLQVVSHLANGAKHFVVEAKHHRSVADSGRPSRYFGARYFGRYLGGRYFGRGRMTLKLTGEAATAIGDSISPIELAEKVHAYWDADPTLKQH
jgi:hypothetical protein